MNPKLNRIRFDEAADDLKTEYAVNGRRSADELERRIRLHLLPSFGGRRLASITTADVNAFILKRQKDVMLIGDGDEREQRRYSNGEINRELTTLNRILNLARQNGKLMRVPHVPMLKERNVRTGFFERELIERILAHLPLAIRPAVQFGYITGWRIPSEVLTLQWRHVNFGSPRRSSTSCSLPLFRLKAEAARQTVTGLPRRSRAAAKSGTIRAQWRPDRGPRLTVSL